MSLQKLKNNQYTYPEMPLLYLIFLVVLQNIICSHILYNYLTALGLSFKDLSSLLLPASIKYLEYLLYFVLTVCLVISFKLRHNKVITIIIVILTSILITDYLLIGVYILFRSNKISFDFADFIPIVWAALFFISLRYFLIKRKIQKEK
jgi:hypothetical protein